jgi:Zn-dependent peptidase ImmA (M78 family)
LLTSWPNLAFGVSAAFDLRQMHPAENTIERACNRVAAEFLVPEAVVRQRWNPKDPDPYQTISRAFKVSQLVAARRLLDLDLITRKMFGAFYQRFMSQEWKKKEEAEPGGSFWNTTPQRVGERFAAELVRAFQEGRVLPTEAYRLTDLKRDSFNELVRRTREREVE